MYRQFGALSGLAMVLIILNHAIEVGLNAPASFGYSSVTGWPRVLLTLLQALGVFAVPTFLLISGSFVAYAAQGRSTRLSPRFVWSSLQHIVWPYLIWSIIFYVAVFLLRDERYSAPGYMKNLLVGYPFHFIPLLVFFYVLSPVLIIVGRRRGVLLLLLIGLYQWLLMVVREPGLLGFALPAWMDVLAPPVLFNTMADWGIYFPLGVVFGLHGGSLRPHLLRLRWLFVTATVGLFVLGMLNAFEIANAPWARYLAPLAFAFLAPTIDRHKIPLVRQFEKIGKRAYGLYLTHLIILYTVVHLMGQLAPGLFRYPLLYFPLLFIIGLMVPLLLMNRAASGRARKTYRYFFG
jgi:fucose 4-O-acetylase-like acetyltransferase